MTDLANNIIQRCFAVDNGALHMDGVSIASVAERYGTPCFAYSRSVLDARLNSLRAALPPEVEVYYSVKANPNLAFLYYFLSQGCGLEIASAGELAQALSAGAPAERVVFAGPGKTDDELELAIRYGIGEIHVESLNEAERISTICRRIDSKSRVAVRVNPTGDAQGGAMRMGGKPAPFGVDEESLTSLIEYFMSNSRLDFRGIHLFAGTQVLDAAVMLTQYRKAIDIARSVVSQTGHPLRTVDFGGGYGIPYFAGEQAMDLTALRSGLADLFAEVRGDAAFSGTRFLIEPGRFLVGESGVYVTRIVDIKESRGKKFLILDGGMNHHLAASGNLGQTIKRNYPIVLLEKLNVPHTETVEVVGPLCTPLDTLGRSAVLPKADVGDLVGILQSGAYGRTASPLGFLSHVAPPEIWLEKGESFVIRARGRAEDSMRDVHVPMDWCKDTSYVR